MRIVVVLLVPLLSGCLADDIWREPFDWQVHAPIGANVDEAQAFAGAIQDLGDQGQEEGDIVVSSAEDLPNNVVFQNMRDFLNQQSPGRGDQVHENISSGAGQVRDGYVTLTGPAAEAYRNGTAGLDGTGGTFEFVAAERTTRVRFTIDVVLVQGQDDNPAPVGSVDVRIFNPRGALVLERSFTQTAHHEDLFIEGTYGGNNEVREHLGGTWRIEVSATGEGAWSVAPESWEPRHSDYEWYQFWRGERRVVVGE